VQDNDVPVTGRAHVNFQQIDADLYRLLKGYQRILRCQTFARSSSMRYAQRWNHR
jgi:hypothetical protein